MDINLFNERIDKMIDEIKSIERINGYDEILIPDERKYRTKLERERNGIPLEPEVIEELRELGGEIGIKFML